MNPVLVLHTTEGPSFRGAKATLEAKRAWSHWLADPATGEFEELVNPDNPARSLRNLAGGVETNNRGGVYQLEIVGYASKVPYYPDSWYAALARWITQICDRHDIPKRFPYPFTGTDGYGLNGIVRLTNSQWLDVTGIIGHQHVPENTHWDPGLIDRLIPLVTGGSPMPDTDFVARIRAATVTAEYSPTDDLDQLADNVEAIADGLMRKIGENKLLANDLDISRKTVKILESDKAELLDQIAQSQADQDLAAAVRALVNLETSGD